MLLYSGLSLTWVAVRRNYLLNPGARSLGQTKASIYRTAAGVGVVLAPLSILLLIIISAYASGATIYSGEDLFVGDAVAAGVFYGLLFALPLQWGFVVLAIRLLIPVVHPEMAREESSG